MGISGNSVAGKSYQSFTVSEELLAKVTEAVQAGEKKARSSGDIQSFEVFYHGMRQNVSCGRIYVVPPAVCNDRKNFPTALLYGCVVRVFGGEELGDLIEKKIGESEFDEYSQADFDSVKEELFEDAEGKEACLIVYAPNWHNKREYIAFHFTKDSEQLKNNLRHQVFSAYYDPRVSSAFNAMMTNVDTTKVDVTDITPKLNFPGLAENVLKQYPVLMKQASDRRTVLLNYKTADAVTKEVLDPQELDVFDSLNQALENSLVPGGAAGAQGEGGFKAPANEQGVPREASKKASDKDIETNPLAAHEAPISNVGPGTEAAAQQKDMVSAMKAQPEDQGRDEEGGLPIGIEIDADGLPIHKGDEEASGKVAADKAAKRTKGMLPLMDIKPGTNGPNDLSGKMMDRFRNGGYVEREWPEGALRDHCAALASDQQAPQSISDHSKEIQAGKYGDQGLSKSATEKWGEVKIAVNFKKKANDEFTNSYIETALWASNDNSDPSGGEPLDRNYSDDDIAPATLRRMAEDCADFQEKNAELLQQAYASGTRDGNPGHAGHDFWLTRNGHGAGFWDSDYPKPLGDQLTKAAKGYGEADLYVGDNGWIFQYGAEGDDQLEPKDPKGYNPTGPELSELSQMGIQGSKQAKQARDASYVASQMGKIVDRDGYDAASEKTKKARAAKEAQLDKVRDKQAVSLDIDSIWAEITEDMGPAPLIDVPTADGGGEQVAEGGDDDKPAGSGGRPNKRDVGDLPEAFRSDEPEDEKSMSDSEADAQEDSAESKEAAWRVDNKYADFVSDLFEETSINEGGTSDEARRLANLAIESEDDIVYDVASNAGQLVDNVKHMDWFVDAVAQAIEEQGIDDFRGLGAQEDFSEENDPERQHPPFEEHASSKTADTADNDVDIDGAAAPASKESGESKTVVQHKQYDAQQSKGAKGKKADTADNPANEGGGEGAILPKTDKEITNTRGDELPKADPIGGKASAKKKADTSDNLANEQGGEGAQNNKANKEKSNTRGKELPSANPIGGKASAKKVADTADNPDNMTDGPGTKIKARATVSDTSGPTPVNTKQGGRKQADTADNPANEKGGDGAISPKTDADIEKTAMPDSRGHSTREEWAKWLQTYGGEKLYDSIMQNAQGAESTCVNCGEPIYLDISEGGGVPDWGTAMDGIDGLDYGCIDSPDTGEDGTGGHVPARNPRGGMKSGNDVSGDIAEAKSEVVSPDTVDADIQQPTTDAKSAAGVEGDMSEAKSELDYSKSEMADEPQATDTIDPKQAADWAGPWECDKCSNFNAGSKCLRCGTPKPGGSGGGELPKGDAPKPKAKPKSEPKSEPQGDQGGSEGGKLVVRVPEGSKIDPDNAQWTNRFEIKSESSDRLYRIAQNKSRGYWACSCPGWISRRNCKHLRALGLPGNEQPFEATLKAGSLSKEAFDAKVASYGDEFPEESQFDFGAGDLADIVLIEDTDAKEE